MSLLFNALEIGKGDAFLLQDQDSSWNCLFDSGANKSKIVSLLQKKDIKKINVAICSHNDIDHANGFIGLLDSNIKIEEIWLPGIWASIILYIKNHNNAIHEIDWDLINDAKKSINEIQAQEQKEKYFAFDTLFNEKEIPISIDHFLESIDIDEFNLIDDTQCEFLRFYPKSYSIFYKQIVIKMNRIIEIAKLSKKLGCRIRWFLPNSGRINNIDNRFKALNSEEISQVKLLKDINSFYIALYITSENKYSLVFEYLKDNKPVIRFSADSNCINQSCPYKNNIIVTAPHHGSESNKIVYQSIRGNDIIWVRSDQKDKHRPCDAFKQIQGMKYCLACRKQNIKSEVRFEFSRGKWVHLHGKACNCL